MGKHTEIPWRYEAATKTIRSVPANYWIANMDSWDKAVDHEANAQRIVKAVNCHDELLAVLKELAEFIEGQTSARANELYEQAIWVIAKAEGKEQANEMQLLS